MRRFQLNCDMNQCMLIMMLSSLISVIYKYKGARPIHTYQKKDVRKASSLMNEAKKTCLLNMKDLTSLEFGYLTRKR